MKPCVSIRLFAAGMALCIGIGFAHAQEEGNEHPWNVSATLGHINYEGDEEVSDSGALNLHLGYDYSERWTFEGVLTLAPSIDGNFRTSFGTEINRLEEQVRARGGPAGVTDTSAIGLAVDALLHVTRWERFDPYITLGAGVMLYADDFANSTDPSIRAGVGAMYHFDDEWALRADARTFLTGDTEHNMTLGIGVMYTMGVQNDQVVRIAGGPQDSDGDGLKDAEELKLGTDPYDPDTDSDGLTDGQEVNTYETDPLNPDTDWDGLKDGAEVLTYKTDPNDRDTDDGGVADGHEVLEDDTDPLNGDDDLLMYELNVKFDTDKAVIKSEYFAELDVIGKALRRDAGATARIEGHADKRAKSKASYNERLSKKRAAAILDYLAEKWGIEKSRMEAVGYGFSRPKAPNDPVAGNPENRRTEIYIRLSDRS